MRLSLNDHGSAQNLVAMSDVTNAKINEIASAQLAVNRKIEHGKVSNPAPVLEVNANGPDVLGL